MRRLAFESETKSAQSREPREKERKKERGENNVYFNGHFVALTHALSSDKNKSN